MANIVITDPTVVGLLRKNISVSATGTTLTDAFFANTVNDIYSRGDNKTYIVGVDFSQSGTTITASTFTFNSGDTIIARL